MVQLAFASAVAILLVVGGLSYHSLVVARENNRWVQHTHEVLENLDELQFAMETITSSVRGYLLVKDESYLDRYSAAKLSLERHTAAVRDLTVDNPVQQRRIPDLERLAAQRLDLANKNIALIRNHQPLPDVTAARAGPGLEIMVDYQALISQMQDEERRLLVLRNVDAEQSRTQTKFTLILGTALGLLITVAAGWTVHRDNSRREIAEKALQESERKYRTLIQGIKDYAIYMLGPQGEIRTWNPGAERMTGCAYEEVAGQNFSRFFPAEDIKRGRPQEILRIAAASGEYEEQGMSVRKDGARFQVRTTLTASRDPAGILRGFSVISRDLTENKESETKYRGLLEAAPDAMVVVNQRGEIVLLNVQAEKQFGYHRDELLGQKVTNIIPVGFAERLIADDLRSAEDASTQQIGTGIELIARRKDGSEFPIEIMLSPLESTEGTLVTAAIRDISVRKAAETHLAQIEALVTSSTDAIMSKTLEGIVTTWNPAAEKLFGYTEREMRGRPMALLIPPDRADEETQILAKIGKGESVEDFETIRRRKNGELIPISVTISPIKDAAGTIIGASKIARDISSRKAAEMHLAQMEGRYRGLLEAAPDAMVVVNQRGEIVLLNVQAEKQFGYHRDELLGQKVTNIIPVGFAERLIADDLRSAEDASTQQIGTGIELIARRKDGSEFPIEIMLSPLESTEGTLVTAAIRNISVRKAAETHLSQMEGRYRGLLEAAPDAMVVVNQGGEIVLLNVQAEKQFGYRRDELLGQKVTNIIPVGFAERLIADDLRSAEDASTQQIGTGIELIARRKDDSEFPIELMLSPLRNTEGILVTAAIRDISVRKKAAEVLLEKVDELNRSNEELGQFAYIASHDLQEPLRMVASYTQLLSRRYKGKLDADADEFIGFAVDGASRMQRLIQDLLSYSRVGTKGRDLTPTSSEDALQQALVNLRGSIEASGALVTHDSLPAVLADEMQLTQLFQNLIGNAIKYQNDGVPRVHISATANDNKKWSFTVKDNGIGIDPQYFERIFGMFQRLHKRDEFAGTGIGLAICKKIVERHGGNISVDSSPGHGAAFHFALARSEKKS
jgi:PAS domain S-box-containing protein